jgi:hypothetical protein
MASAKTKKKQKKSSKAASGGMAASKRNKLAEQKFAFPKERKEPLNDAKHVRNAISRFDQVKGVSDAERNSAWSRIKRAAKKFGVEMGEKSWRSLGASGKKKSKSKGRGSKSAKD